MFGYLTVCRDELKIKDERTYKAWYCGHWHINKRIDRMHFLMESYEEIQPEEVQDNG